MERVILHCDANKYYASIEILDNPALRPYPVAVCGSQEDRHGIVLTANAIAKGFGIQTGMANWQAKQVCPNLIILHPRYERYLHFSRLMRKIYLEYSDRVEAFGLDENWVDLSNPGVTIEDGERIANAIRNRVREELGLTISVGVSFNKIFAKLGSDLKKPDATTVIRRDDFKDKVWPLPVSELLYVGRQTTKKYADINIRTIGDLAKFDSDCLRRKFGKTADMLQSYARGVDVTPVMPVSESMAIKSIGNSTTAPSDIESRDDALCIVTILAECVAMRLREHGFRSRNISIAVRNVIQYTDGNNRTTTSLDWHSCQHMLGASTNLAVDIIREAMKLFDERYARMYPFRGLGISCGTLVPESVPVQMDLFGNADKQARMEQLERNVDMLRNRFGNNIVQKGIVLIDRKAATLDPKADHTIHPVAMYGM
ncbi:MAG: DNA polymerase IV [Candidatus Limiplasma sp.]|nr:DNA polymerase IV [Candidatus Limiplasma sp.]